MAHLDMGTSGVKRQSWFEPNPCDALRKIMVENPKADEDKICMLMTKHVLRNLKFIKPIIVYWVARNRLRLMETDKPDPKKRDGIQKAKEAADGDIGRKLQGIIHDEAKKIILNSMMPNGKSLRECSFRYLKKLGGIFALISKFGKPDQIVGDVLSDVQLEKLQTGQ